MAEQIINIERMEQVVGLFGNLDENVRMIESELSVSISFRSGEIRISGEAENVMRAARTVNGLLSLLNKGETLTEQSVRYVMSLASDGDEAGIEKLSDTDCICITSKGKPIKPKTIGQKKYVEAIRENTVTIGVGPAGTGKTYLAVAMAVEAFRAKKRQPYNTDKTGGRGRRKAGISARRPSAEGRPVPAAALRRTF